MKVSILLVLVLVGCAGSQYKPYFPAWFEPGMDIPSVCAEKLIVAGSCADIGFCAQYGVVLKKDPAKAELCVD